MREDSKYVLVCPGMWNGHRGDLLDDIPADQVLVYLRRPKGDEFAEAVQRVDAQDEFPGSLGASRSRNDATERTERQSDEQAYDHDVGDAAVGAGASAAL